MSKVKLSCHFENGSLTLVTLKMFFWRPSTLLSKVLISSENLLFLLWNLIQIRLRLKYNFTTNVVTKHFEILFFLQQLGTLSLVIQDTLLFLLILFKRCFVNLSIHFLIPFQPKIFECWKNNGLKAQLFIIFSRKVNTCKYFMNESEIFI